MLRCAVESIRDTCSSHVMLCERLTTDGGQYDAHSSGGRDAAMLGLAAVGRFGGWVLVYVRILESVCARVSQLYIVRVYIFA